MLFLILATHSPDMCPLTNSKVREHVLKAVPEWKNMAEKLGVKLVSEPLVNNEHMVTCVVEAQDVETLDEFINQSGMQQWNNVKMIPSTPIENAIKKYDEVKPIL
ncbi:hypothetical protein Ngar_c07150 [Candidatus Nitrososphaera gargensis Ga9.2]|uniref:DUF3303 domain-containing protein n=1 Tax=Nitrososphaera gargensis (strain Ga9.2) TaxID=1237085 RepID=K0IFP8_NITGG|nr:hypothetical protein [Candidatus Nitrososphaera gargensis]AFU57658.1 hypothetical protein Ngar_c07150 [Candidatus Nitrososphaera gargensis Ga9.2]